jgi:hypothetical protein
VRASSNTFCDTLEPHALPNGEVHELGDLYDTINKRPLAIDDLATLVKTDRCEPA